MNSTIYINTSNPGKLQEYRDYLKPAMVDAQNLDLPEPDADPLTIIRYKASQFDRVLVDDVALDIEGLNVGVNIRWLLDEINSNKYLNRRCTYVCRIAIKVENLINVYTGSVKGKLVKPKGDCFGFGKYFLPEGTDKTLGEYMDPKFNARYLAVQNFLTDSPSEKLPVLKEWNGKFQVGD